MQQRFRSENKTAMSANVDKIIQSIDSIETYAYRTNSEVMHTKEMCAFLNVEIY